MADGTQRHVDAVEAAVESLRREAATAPPASRAILETVARESWELIEKIGAHAPCPARGAANLLALAAGVVLDLDEAAKGSN